MCDLCQPSVPTTAARPRPNRRALLAGAAGTVGAAGFAGWPGAASAGTTRPAPTSRKPLEVVLLGTQAGPPIVADRTGISTAVIVEGRVYLVDCGRAAATQYVRAGLRLENLAGIFLTHLHADHVADLYNFFLLGGYVPQPNNDHLTSPVDVYGPGSAGGLQPPFGGGPAPVVNPADPTPGTAALLESCVAAYAYSSNVFLRDSGIPDIEGLFQAHEVRVPDVGSSYTHTAPTMSPFVVMEDDRVRVSAVLVPHGPAYPAFAYRFDTDHGSVTLSGDTTYTPNLPTLAHNTDLLVHEAINVKGANLPPVFASHLLNSHVEVQKVGPIAQQAGAKQLVLSHLADLGNGNGPINVGQWQHWARRGYTRGKVTVGQDLGRIVVASSHHR